MNRAFTYGLKFNYADLDDPKLMLKILKRMQDQEDKRKELQLIDKRDSSSSSSDCCEKKAKHRKSIMKVNASRKKSMRKIINPKFRQTILRRPHKMSPSSPHPSKSVE